MELKSVQLESVVHVHLNDTHALSFRIVDFEEGAKERGDSASESGSNYWPSSVMAEAKSDQTITIGANP